MPISRAKSQAEAAAREAKADELRQRAARQAAIRETQEVEPDPVVECTVLPLGHGKISMGQHVGGVGEAHYEEGETPSFPLPVAIALYDRSFVNFEGAREASKAAKAERARQAAEARAAAQAAADEAEDA